MNVHLQKKFIKLLLWNVISELKFYTKEQKNENSQGEKRIANTLLKKKCAHMGEENLPTRFRGLFKVSQVC